MAREINVDVKDQILFDRKGRNRNTRVTEIFDCFVSVENFDLMPGRYYWTYINNRKYKEGYYKVAYHTQRVTPSKDIKYHFSAGDKTLTKGVRPFFRRNTDREKRILFDSLKKQKEMVA
ncbi:MAG: hypothetical protein ACJAV6_000608 [Candidatus Paceibacteria bacterium]|jgi:hypothetical protein